MKALHILFLLSILSTSGLGQSTWTALEDFGGDPRILAATLSIGTNIYLVGGLKTGSSPQPTKENWEYNSVTDEWIEKQEYGGEAIWGAFSFVISGKGYVGTGDSGTPGNNNYLSGVFEYNPLSNSWQNKASFGERSQGVGFSINGKGYVVWGYENENGDKDETVMEYDPTDGTGGSWTTLSDISTVVDDVVVDGIPGVVFVLNNEAFVTGGHLTSETWKFNPANDSWNKMTDVVINPYAGFIIGEQAYLVGARDQCLAVGNSGCQNWQNVIMKYNTVSGTWSQVEVVPSQLSVSSSVMFSADPCETSVVIGNTDNGDNFRWSSDNFFITSGSSELCDSDQATYSLSNLPIGTSVSWNVSNHFDIISTSGSSVLVESNGLSGSGWVRPTISGSCGNLVLEEFVISAAEPFWDPDIAVQNGVEDEGYWCTTHSGNAYTLSTYNLMDSHIYRIKNSQGTVLYTSTTQYGTDGTILYNPGVPGWYDFEVKGTNSCGTTDWYGLGVEFVDCSMGGGGGGEEEESLIFPNPAEDGFVVISSGKSVNSSSIHLMKSGNDAESGNSETIDLVVYSSDQQLIHRESCDGKMVVDTSLWKSGTYFFHITIDDKTTIRRVKVKN